jgi:putative nucleotidyltransferase with HDIG domain
MSQRPSTTVAELSEVIERDPGLSARVLRMANSALYAPTRPCTSISNAAVRLGIRNIGRIAVALVAQGMFDDVDPLGARIRDHCIGVSLLVRRLALGVRQVDPDDLFLVGLLHDIGKLLAMQTSELDYHSIDGDLKNYPTEAHLKERQLVGWDHAVLAAHVIEQWQLPREIATIVALHHQPGRAFTQAGSIPQAVAYLRLADRLEYQLVNDPTIHESFFAKLEQESAFEYTHHDASTLRGLWPQLLLTIEDGRTMMMQTTKQ